MRVSVLAVGKMKDSPERDLCHRYLKQTPWNITISEFESKKTSNSEERKKAEAEWLLNTAKTAHKCIALDERGKSLDSEALASKWGDWQQDGCSHVSVIIGGADGLDESVRQHADLVLSFGALTWPHMLVRTMLCEQLYRVHTILTNHPYHRS